MNFITVKLKQNNNYLEMFINTYLLHHTLAVLSYVCD